jgi:hypothetical protein
MRRTVVIASAVVAAAAASVTVSAARASQVTGTAGSAGAAAARQITVVEHALTDTTVDLPPTGDSAGDLLPFANPVFNRANTHKVGHDQGSCIRTVVGKAYQCSWTTFLGNGSLVVAGPFYDNHDSVLAITGGTGAESQARGTMHLHASGTNRFVFRFNIQN